MHKSTQAVQEYLEAHKDEIVITCSSEGILQLIEDALDWSILKEKFERHVCEITELVGVEVEADMVSRVWTHDDNGKVLKYLMENFELR